MWCTCTSEVISGSAKWENEFDTWGLGVFLSMHFIDTAWFRMFEKLKVSVE